VQLGAGRAKKSDPVDHTVGFMVHRKVGDHVDRNQPLITIYADGKAKLVEVRDSVRSAFGWSDGPFSPLPLFYE
jgi:pyrimidine-nucleoside phosphorylase